LHRSLLIRQPVSESTASSARHIDHALNKSRGEIWIDQATYEVARVSFQLMERVRLWWGILGSISDATGHLERAPIAENAWLATALLDIEPRLRKLMGYRHLPTLRASLKRELKIDTTTSKKKAA